MQYILYILPALIFSLWAGAHVKHVYRRYARFRPASGETATQVARRILDANGLTSVRIGHVPGEMTDHFDPRSNAVFLSDGVYDVSSVAAIGIAAHECGHAIQYAQEYTPIRIRAAIIPATNVASNISVPLVMIGLILSAYAEQFLAVAYAGVILFGACVLFQLVTLPVEFNASGRALSILRSEQILQDSESAGAKKVLSAAAMTYVAALATTIFQFLYLLSSVSGNRRRK